MAGCLSLLSAVTALAPGLRTPTAPVAQRAAVRMQFQAPKSTDTAAEDQMKRVAASGMSPAEYAVATREAAKSYLAETGAHVGGAGAGAQQASFLPELWGVSSIPDVPAEAAGEPSRVLATVYEIGGPLTGVLSGSVAKTLPLIPHIGIRCHGVEFFYSDHIEERTVPVMQEMLGERPQVTLDLGTTSMSEAEVRAVVAELESAWTADDYHVFDKNCVHFADALAARVCDDGRRIPQPLLQGVLDVSERMLDSLPEWRRALGRRVMNEVTRLVVVSWGKASKEKKEQTADSLGVSRGG